MRFLHTSDWHLGRSLHGVDLIPVQRAVLRELCGIVAAPPDGVAVDAVLIAGDVYDRAVPPIEAVRLFEEVLTELLQHCQVLVISGNHDSATRLGFGAELFTPRLHIRTNLAEIGSPVLVGNTAIYPIPYLDPDVARLELAADPGCPLDRSHQAVTTAALDRCRRDLATRAPGTASIVLAHSFVVGGIASASERPIVVGGVDSVAADTFSGFDYVALGHLHGPQTLRSPSGTPLQYSGSPLRYSFSERSQLKSITLVDLAGRARTSWVELTQPRGMAELTGTLAELLALTGHEQDWLRVVVTDPVRPDRLLERITARFPFVLQVFHDPAGASPARASAGAESGLVRSPVQLCRQFVEQVTGFPPSADECTLFERAYETALAAAAADTGLSR